MQHKCRGGTKMNKTFFTLSVLLFSAVNCLAKTTPFHPITSKIPGAVESMYTKTVSHLLDNWKETKAFCSVEGREVQHVALKTPEKPYYVGFKKCALMDATLANAAAVIDKVESYQQLFPGNKRVDVAKRDGNLLTLEWERIIPVFFVPNIVYQISYLTDKTNPSRVVYRYQLQGGERLTANDGLEVFEKISDKQILFVNYEYYEANYDTGLLGIKAISADQAWRESLDGSFRSVFSIRNKAEHPDWDLEKVKAEAEKELLALPKTERGQRQVANDGALF
jgi:hypothetical protein